MGTVSIGLTPEQAVRVSEAMGFDAKQRVSNADHEGCLPPADHTHFNTACAQIAQEIGFRPPVPGKWSVSVMSPVDACWHSSPEVVLIFTESP